jgi:hypothetical protein
MYQMTAEEILESVNKTTEAIKKNTGISSTFFRPPKLAVSSVMYDAIDMHFVEGVLGMDWAGCNTSAE